MDKKSHRNETIPMDFSYIYLSSSFLNKLRNKLPCVFAGVMPELVTLSADAGKGCSADAVLAVVVVNG